MNDDKNVSQDDIDKLDDVMNDFDNKLNLTSDQNDIIKDIMDPKLQEEYKEMMNDVKEEDLQNLLGNILGDLNSQKLDENQNMDQFANSILQNFMNKEILEEPLIEAQKAYTEFFQKNEEKLCDDEFGNFIGQAECIDDILSQLQKEPENKEKLIQLFEKMQQYGNPPKEIMEVQKDGPFNIFDQNQDQCVIF